MTRALVVIDVQESFRQQPNWSAVSEPRIVDKVNRLVERVRSDGDVVIWVLHAEPGSGGVFDPALGHVRLIEGLTPLTTEPMLTKSTHNAFTTTNLAKILTERGIRELLVCGIKTEQCCETTTRLAADLGYEVTFVIDATATTPIPHRDAPVDRTLDELLAGPATLPVAEIIARTEYVLSGRFATIRTVDELTAGRLAAAS